MATYNAVIEGLRIFATMDPTGGLSETSDYGLYAGENVVPEMLSPHTLETLAEMGWQYEEQFRRWFRYV